MYCCNCGRMCNYCNVTTSPPQEIKSKLIPKGYTVLEDVPATEIKKLKLVKFLKEGEKYIDGQELRKRAVELKANLGIKDAEYLLENQEKIPKEFQNYYIVFTGTLLRGSGGGIRVPCLSFYGGHWVLRFCWLASHFDGNDRVACSE